MGELVCYRKKETGLFPVSTLFLNFYNHPLDIIIKTGNTITVYLLFFIARICESTAD